MPVPREAVHVSFHVLVPTAGAPVLADSTRTLVEALRVQTRGYVRGFVHVIAVDVGGRRLWGAEAGESIDGARVATHLSLCRPSWRSVPKGKPSAYRSTSSDAAHVCVLMNAAFLLGDPPPIMTLIERAERAPAW